jgi:hypothetical protein
MGAFRSEDRHAAQQPQYRFFVIPLRLFFAARRRRAALHFFVLHFAMTSSPRSGTAPPKPSRAAHPAEHGHVAWYVSTTWAPRLTTLIHRRLGAE